MPNEAEVVTAGSCLCGGVRFRARFRPDAAYYCHCAQCRRANGSTFATNVAVARRDLSFAAGENLIRAFESSPGNHCNFCSRCGSPLYSECLDESHVVYVRAGTLDDDGVLSVCVHIYAGSKASWYEIVDDLPRHEGDADVDEFP